MADFNRWERFPALSALLDTDRAREGEPVTFRLLPREALALSSHSRCRDLTIMVPASEADQIAAIGEILSPATVAQRLIDWHGTAPHAEAELLRTLAALFRDEEERDLEMMVRIAERHYREADAKMRAAGGRALKLYELWKLAKEGKDG